MTSLQRRRTLRHAVRSRVVVLLGVTLGVPVAGCWVERVPEAERDERSIVGIRNAVQAMLDSSAVAWNEGRIEGFMDDYLKSDNTTYIGGVGLVEGWEAIRERYAPSFAPGAKRDSLRFMDLKLRRLSATLALGTARYVLYGEDGLTTGSGPFTLVLRKVGREWRIIHDHSSADPPPSADTPPPADLLPAEQ